MDPTVPAPVDPRWLVEAAAKALGHRPDAPTLSAAFVAHGPPKDAAGEVVLLQRLAESVGLRVVVLHAAVDDVVAAASERLPVVVQTREGLWLVIGCSGGRVRVRSAPDDDRILPLDELRARVTGVAAHVELALPFDPTPHDDHHEHPTPTARLWRLLATEREDLLIVAAYALAVGVLSLVMPLAVQTLVNTVVFGTFLQPLFWLSVLALAGTSMAAALSLAQLRVVEVLQRRVFVRLVADLAHRLPRVRAEVVERQNTAILVNRFFDVLTVQKALSTLLLDGVAVALSGVMGTLLLAVYSPWFLFYAAFLWLSLLGMLAVTGFRAPSTAIAKSYAKHEVAAWIEQIASAPALFRYGGAADWASERADALSRGYLAARDVHFRIWFRQVAGLLLLAAVASTTLLGLGGWLVVAGKLSVGQLLAAELVVSVVLGSFAKLGKQLESLYDLLAALDKVGHLLDLPLERAGGAALPTASGPLSVEVRAVSRSAGRALFADASWSLRPGERLALTGASGSGRSAMLELLAGGHLPDAGWVSIDGVDLRDVHLPSLRRRVVLVRGVELVVGTVADNVRAGRREVTDERVRAVLARVGLLEVVAALPAGLSTPLGPAGRPLSDTQVRLLVLARALAGEPGLLLIDDLLDQLGPTARAAALQALLGSSREHTVVVVTQDPVVAARCDRRLVFERPRDTSPAALTLDGGATWAQ
jgi:putative ABC transport system ATP-binding protein